MASFVVVVLGGLGSMTGSLLGGLILGVTVSHLAPHFFPGSFKEVLMFGIFLGVLLFARPACWGAKYDDDDSGHSSRPNTGRGLIVPILFLIVALAIPSFSNAYLLEIGIVLLMYAYLGSSWDILGGWAGQMSFGHAAFFGLGAYTSAVL